VGVTTPYVAVTLNQATKIEPTPNPAGVSPTTADRSPNTTLDSPPSFSVTP
jgi:hypothetical protein